MVTTDSTQDPTQGQTLAAPPHEVHWETLDSLILGRSSIDLTSMPTRTREEAYDLLYNYGYDINHPADKAELSALQHEAVSFINNRLLSPTINWSALGEPEAPAGSIPPHLLENADVVDLIMAASLGREPDCWWACAILKVAHTLSHIHNKPAHKYCEEASDMIVSRFHRILTPQPDGTYLLKGNGGLTLTLDGFETKYQKARESMLVKLLCKKENIAEDVWDLVGVRLITETPAEAILAIDILRQQKVIIFPNVIPSRSRNTLIDYDDFKIQYEKRLSDKRTGIAHFDSVADLFRALPTKPANTDDFKDNTSSSPHYRSIHITCRHLLRVKMPGTQEETRLTFPYEIQLMDRENYRQSQEGHSAHTMYKLKQLALARRRTLGLLLAYKPGP